MTRFPSELEDAVIDFCHSDRGTLATCGLVCRDWLPASRYHKFSSVSLTANNITGFLEITSASEAITHLVREVELCYCGPFPPEVVSVLMLLKRTARLSLHPLRDEVVRVASTSSLAVALASLQIVHLKFDFRSRFESLGQVIGCVCLCPQLESLEVGGSWMRGVEFEPCLPKGLHTLTLTCDLANFLTWLLTLDELPNIRKLNLQHIVRREIPAIVQYLEALGETLESLTLAFRDHGALADMFASRVDLAQNTNLREFALEGSAPGVLNAFIQLIPQLYLCKTVTATLCIRHGNYPQADQVVHAYPWETLDAILSDPERCGLERLSLAVIEPVSVAPQAQVLEYILDQLPLTRGRGIIF
ncbi:hypothetical protein FB45DRAFT_870757 [Roridomyces roridus]|uniref:F-box domain-containing protein n=1 Tax=Roridomyces roridus TaxID=1738132 RepID=A0AAD7BGY5_9AGAR|nr:hypothetical protein FB45DRAFT_870757 [Roridomyces roridus]